MSPTINENRYNLSKIVSITPASFDRLCNFVTIAPANLLALKDEQLKAIGFSRQTASYVRALSQAIATEQLDLDSLSQKNDDLVRLELKQIKGIGDWTVDIYLLMALQRPDVFAKSDLAAVVVVQKIKKLSESNRIAIAYF
jgi:DNA-3-methyladenine glycosylase II